MTIVSFCPHPTFMALDLTCTAVLERANNCMTWEKEERYIVGRIGGA